MIMNKFVRINWNKVSGVVIQHNFESAKSFHEKNA